MRLPGSLPLAIPTQPSHPDTPGNASRQLPGRQKAEQGRIETGSAGEEEGDNPSGGRKKSAEEVGDELGSWIPEPQRTDLGEGVRSPSALFPTPGVK